MQQACEGHPTPDIQKSKDMVGKPNPADHEPEHSKEYQYIHNQLKNAGRCISAFEKGFVPIPV